MNRWAIEILLRDGTRVGQREVEPDFSPLLESARLAFVRRHGPGAASNYDRPVEIAPVWMKKLGEPYVGGLQLTVAEEAIYPLASNAIFRTYAAGAAAEFIKSGAIEEGAKFVYLVTCYAGEEAGAQPELANRFRVSSLPVEVEVSPGTWPGESPAEIGILMPPRVLEEVSAITKSRRGVETGGVLLGHLRWDHARKELFLEVTEQLHARDAVGDAARLRFTPECWAGMRGALALRQRGESIVGWWHSHCGNELCAECPPEKRETCPLQEGFLSDHDKSLHRTLFSRAFMPALVATDSAGGEIRFAMFGWRDGVLESRDYQIAGSGAAYGPELKEQGAELCGHPKLNS